MILKFDCVHFPGDRPCNYQKNQGIKCDNCNFYKTKGTKILIIKLDALGDVLRTTSILHGLKEKYQHSFIFWLTKNNAIPIFKNNNFVDKAYSSESIESIQELLPIEFDLLINLDPSAISSALCSNLNAKKKLGFATNCDGSVYPVNKEAEEWFEMGAFDELKKANKKTYQSIMQDIACLKTSNVDIIINLTEEEIEFGNKFLELNRIDTSKKIIGINSGASPRWELKKWTDKNLELFITKILIETDFYIFLYGSNNEKERMDFLSQINDERIFSTGYKNSLRDFFSLLNLSDLVLTGDTLAMHTAAALNKKVVALFGPTSTTEIEDYGRITKIVSDLNCLVCYKMRCNFKPNCMESINYINVFQNVINQLK